MARSTPPTQLDDVSLAIIEQLQQDGRRSYAAIGKVVGLSEAAVRQRVQRLVESGVMQIVAAVTDPLQLGFARAAMLGIRVSGPTAPVADALVEMDEVIYVVVTAGSIDIVAEVVARVRRGPAHDLGPDPADPRRPVDRDVRLSRDPQGGLQLGRAAAAGRRRLT